MENANSSLDDVIAGLRSVIEIHQAKRAALKAELEQADLEYKRADRALRLLTSDERSRVAPQAPKRSKASTLSAERLELLRAVVLDYAKDHEEFRQVDIRTLPGLDPALATSSILATGFEGLRQEGSIRFARQEGNNKWFRLTRQALNGHG